MLGQTLYELKVASFDSSIDVSNLNKGTYFLNLKTGRDLKNQGGFRKRSRSKNR